MLRVVLILLTGEKMSLVSSYVLSDDGYWYKNPVLGDDEYFICFDDDDPPELVIRVKDRSESEMRDCVNGILSKLSGKIVSQPMLGGYRLFKGKFKKSYSVFIEINRRIPADFIKEHDGRFKEQPQTQGVFYNFQE